MIFRLTNWAVMSLALFYVAEGTGLLERGKYFPTLPRMEARAGDPSAWFGAVQWGVTALTQGAGQATASYGGSGGSYYGGAANDHQEYATAMPTSATSNEPYRAIRLGAYAEREAARQDNGILKRLAGYYGG
jgi:hypothetical protein